MSIFCPQDAPHPFLLILALSTWRWFCLLVKGTGCHSFLHVLHLLPSHLGRHYSRFVLCYSTSASPPQSFCCVQQIVFHDCYLWEPFKMILLGSRAVSWEMAESGCHVLTALGGTQEPLHCSQLMPCTPELALSQAQILSSLWQLRLMEQFSGLSGVLSVFEHCWCSCNCTGWTNRLLIAPVIAQEMFCQLHPFFPDV